MSNKPKLHELLAVENDLDNVSKKVVQEASNTFKTKGQLFSGAVRIYKSLEDENGKDDYSALTETRDLETTVFDKLQYVGLSVGRYWDAVLQKESTNQIAVADLDLDGVVLATDVPATFLLGMEKRLSDLRKMYEQIPTLTPGVKWIKDPDSGANVYKTEQPDKKYRTRKAFRHQVLVEPTEHHPAQIEKWEENENIGTFETTHWSGAITTNEKSEMLGRIDKLTRAVKKARQRANTAEVKKVNVARKLIDYINTGNFS